MLLCRFRKRSPPFEVFSNTLICCDLRGQELDDFFRFVFSHANDSIQICNQVVAWVDDGSVFLGLQFYYGIDLDYRQQKVVRFVGILLRGISVRNVLR